MGDELEDPTPPGAGGGGAIDVEQVARDTMRDTKEHVGSVTPTSTTAASDGADQVDPYGRTFDPNVHVVKLDGTPATRRGFLISKPGMKPDGAKKARPASPPAGGGIREELRDAAKGSKPEILPADDHVDQVEHIDTPMDAEEFERRAQAGARFVRKALGKIGRWMAGPDEGEYKTIDGSNEGVDIEDATLDAQKEYQVLVPAGSLVMLAFAVGSYMVRVWNSDLNTERVEEVVARINGKPVKPKPRQVEQARPEQETDQPVDDGKPKVTPTTGRVVTVF